ncbi:MAG: AmmeMemoRadiSam system protein B [Candidatus Bathyarchaeia archaeon]
MKVRRPYVAGSWYPGTAESLRREVERCLTHRLGYGRVPKVVENGPRLIIGLVSPHAGYMYSGPIASIGYGKLAEDGIPGSVIMIGPNHTGLGSAVSVMVEGSWETPLGSVEIDTDLAKAIVEASGIADIDDYAHRFEHSLEIQLPFLQYFYGSNFKIVPICMMLRDYDTARELGESISSSLAGRNVIILASTDFTHYEPHKIAVEKDRLAIEAILKLDAELLLKRVEENDISMCGPGPVAAMIVACRKLGALRAELLGYATSGDITGDRSAVVGYASIAVYYR